MNHFSFVVVLLLFLLLSSFLSEEEKIKYSKKSTITIDYDQAQAILVGYKDTMSSDSLFLVKTKENIPIHYFKNIITNVCFNDECRLLKAKIYWNITGRYLGFELPEGEYLSKREHKPFSDHEYKRLNDLLADPTLPLGGISFEDLIELPVSETDSIDGVSRASTPEISEIVVKGAAYTTYTLWNIVHGPTIDFVSSITEKQLTPDLIDLILKSPNITDRVWVLNRIRPETTFTSKLTDALLDIISGDDFFLTYSAINAIHPSHLHSDSLQIALFSIFQKANHSIQGMIIEKLIEAPFLSLEVKIDSRNLLEHLNGKQLGDILKLYKKHSINDSETHKSVAKILKNENQFISRKAYKFLKESNISDEEIEKLKTSKR